MQTHSSMVAELSKVRKRLLVNPFAAAAPKEWWYAGCHDPESATYFSFFFFRMPLLDAARVTLFDPATGTLREFGWKGRFKAIEADGTLRIEIAGKDLKIVYRRVDDGNWRFVMECDGWDVDLAVRRTLPAFERFEDRLGVPSGIVHWLGNQVAGRIQAQGVEHVYRQARGYADHSWGLVARRVGWHWIAVQSDKFCLVSLVNTGVVAQNYTQVMVRREGADGDGAVWNRLDPQVVFGERSRESGPASWEAVSTDMEVAIETLQGGLYQERIPPVIPVLVDIRHQESFVAVRGRVRIDGIWQDVGELFGVMEVHRGIW